MIVLYRLMIVAGLAFAASGSMKDCRAQTLQPLTPIEPRARLDEKNPFVFTAEFVCNDDFESGELVVKARLAEGNYLYSLTQDEGLATKIEVAIDDRFFIDGPFRPDRPPTIVEQDQVLGIRLEKHFREVEFHLPLKFSGGVKFDELTIDIRLNGQVCSDKGSCRPIRNKMVQARFAGVKTVDDLLDAIERPQNIRR